MSGGRSDQEDGPEREGLLLGIHRSTVHSTRGMSTAVLLGSSFAVAMGLFAWLGHAADERYDTAPWGVLGGVLLGLLYGAYEVWKIIRFTAADDAKREPGPDDTETPEL